MRTLWISSILLSVIPSTCFAQSMLLEQLYASAPAPVEDVGSLTGRAARKYREQLQRQYLQDSLSSASVSSILETDVPSDVVEVVIPAKPLPPVQNSYSSVSSVSSASSVSLEKQEKTPQYPEPVERKKTQEELDTLTLEQLEEYANEAQTNRQEQEQLLSEGFVITGTSAQASPLSLLQRTAILRRNVRTVPQLKLFARALAESDANVRKIAVEGERITIAYRKKARLFGLIPVPYILETTLDQDDMFIHKPWWLFVAADDVDEYTEQLQQELQNSALSDSEKYADITHLLKSLQNVLQVASTAAHQ